MLNPNTPVLVGIGAVTQRFEDSQQAAEPIALMVEAANLAADDAGDRSILSRLERIYVPRGRWNYSDPGRYLADALGATGARSILAHLGVLQQTLIGDACRRIAAGEIGFAAVIGGDAGYRLLRAGITGMAVTDHDCPGEPDQVMHPHEPMQNEAERRAGLDDATSSYAIIESAFRAASGMGVGEHRDHIGRLYAGFTEIAADNPHAWRRDRLDAAAIAEPGPKNAMLSYPYTKCFVSAWSVDQAGAMIFCAAREAEALGIPRSKWVIPVASTESNFMLDLSARPRLNEVPGARIAGRAALDALRLDADQIDFIDLYTCFPVAVETYARELGLAPSRTDLTVTGGMPFAGGPFNNYVIQSTIRVAELLRQKPGSTGLVSCVSGFLTKQGFGAWANVETPYDSFEHRDVTAEVALAVTPVVVDPDFSGRGQIAGYTVMSRKGGADRAIVVVDTADGRRAVAIAEDQDYTTGMSRDEEYVGRQVDVKDGQFSLSP